MLCHSLHKLGFQHPPFLWVRDAGATDLGPRSGSYRAMWRPQSLPGRLEKTGKDLMPNSLRLLAEFAACGCGAWGPAFTGGLSPLLVATCLCLPLVLSPRGHFVNPRGDLE